MLLNGLQMKRADDKSLINSAVLPFDSQRRCSARIHQSTSPGRPRHRRPGHVQLRRSTCVYFITSVDFPLEAVYHLRQRDNAEVSDAF